MFRTQAPEVWFYFPFCGASPKSVSFVWEWSLKARQGRRYPADPVRSVSGVWDRSQAAWADSSVGQSGWPRLGRFLFFCRGACGLPEFSSLELASKNEPRQNAMCNSCPTSLATTSCLVSCFKAAMCFRVNSTAPLSNRYGPQRHSETAQPQRHRETTLLLSRLFGLKHEGSSGLKKCEAPPEIILGKPSWPNS